MVEKPLLLDAVLGNSRLLATVDAVGELVHIFWPRIDYAQQLQRTMAGLFLPGSGRPPLWLAEGPWERGSAYEGHTAILKTWARRPDCPVHVEAWHFIPPARDLVVRHYRLVNCSAQPQPVRFLYYLALDLEESPLYNTTYAVPEQGVLISYRRHTAAVLGSEWGYDRFTCGRREWGDRSLADAADGDLDGHVIEMGATDAAALWDLGTLAAGASAELTIYLSFATERATALAQWQQARSTGWEALRDETAAYWEDWLRPALERVSALTASARSSRPLRPSRSSCLNRSSCPLRSTRSGQIAQALEAAPTRKVFIRSLITMKLMSDEREGGIIAAPEFDPERRTSGGYGYCWGRDAAYVTTALDEAGFTREAAAFYDWAVRAQEPDGSWLHRYWVDGSPAPSWGLIQIDETGSILFGMGHHWRLTGDRAFLRRVWPAVRKAAAFLVDFTDPETGLPRPSVDLWEERIGELSYSSAAVVGGLRAAADLAAAMGGEDPQAAELASRWRARAHAMREAIFTHLYSAEKGRFLRATRNLVSEEGYRWAQSQSLAARAEILPLGYRRFAVMEDSAVDASLLGLAVPFGVVDPGDPRMVATAAAIRQRLWKEPVGGLGRYEGDAYRGGNPWVLCTLWLGQYALARGDAEQAVELLQWAAGRANHLGLLPEQAERSTGQPAWVVPLTWSAAMYVGLYLELLRSAAADSWGAEVEGEVAAGHHPDLNPTGRNLIEGDSVEEDSVAAKETDAHPQRQKRAATAGGR
ncbi:MAG: glycoside hydrolase family 15 [Firmicutes bacterium]|nr:glycoside hydrolase family 15 [Bacillota bacterium]